MTTTESNRTEEPNSKPAIVALVTAILGIVTLGFAAPVGLILALMALRRPPRTMALLALVLSIGGMVLGAVILVKGIDRAQTAAVFVDLELRLQDFHNDYDRFPGDDEFEGLFGRPEDAWGGRLVYRQIDDGYELRSAGPDGRLGTADDLRGGPDPE